MKSSNVYLCVSAIIVLSVVLLLLPSSEFPVDAADRNWRYNEHGRNIAIDICVMCTQPGPQGPLGPQGPQGPQGPAGDTRQTIVILHDDGTGHAAGWNPGNNPGGDNFAIKAPIELGSEFSIEATFTNPPRNGFMFTEPCFSSGGMDISTNTFGLTCALNTHNVVEEGATLTYIITK